MPAAFLAEETVGARARSSRIEGYAIVSEDGMLADATGVMPAALQIDADARFFEQGLDGVDVVVHGRHSQEQQRRSHLRHRLVLTHRIAAIEKHPSNPRALLWNPAGTSFEQAMLALGTPGAPTGVIGATDVFALFLRRFDVFHLSRVPGVHLPGGRPVFPEVPMRAPEEVLAAQGLVPNPAETLDPGRGVTMVRWRRSG